MHEEKSLNYRYQPAGHNTIAACGGGRTAGRRGSSDDRATLQLADEAAVWLSSAVVELHEPNRSEQLRLTALIGVENEADPNTNRLVTIRLLHAAAGEPLATEAVRMIAATLRLADGRRGTGWNGSRLPWLKNQPVSCLPEHGGSAEKRRRRGVSAVA